MLYNGNMNKDYYRIRITKYERDCLETFYAQLVDGSSKRKTLSEAKTELFKMCARTGIDAECAGELWNRTYSSYLVLQKALSLKKTVQEKDEAFRKCLNGRKFALGTSLVGILNKIEARKKNAYLEEIWDESGVFYICSCHSDCAEGHLDYQGKVYIEYNWREKVQNVGLIKKIQAYIRNHKIRTIEWVMGAPVWMMTRPNCRHYFIPVSTEDVLHSSAKSLIRKYGAGEVPKKRFKLDVKKFNENNKDKLLKDLSKLARKRGIKKEKV